MINTPATMTVFRDLTPAELATLDRIAAALDRVEVLMFDERPWVAEGAAEQHRYLQGCADAIHAGTRVQVPSVELGRVA